MELGQQVLLSLLPRAMEVSVPLTLRSLIEITLINESIQLAAFPFL